MSMLRLRSAASPFDDAVLAGQAARLLILAEAIGAWEPKNVVSELDSSLFGDALNSLAAAGVAASASLEWEAHAGKGKEHFATWLSTIRDAILSSPLPSLELPKLESLFGTERLAELAGVASSTIRRYLTAQREVPDDVAEHVHLVARIVGDLAGSYNERGIRRWFDRPRSQLGGRTPAEALERAWGRDEREAEAVVALAEALVS